MKPTLRGFQCAPKFQLNDTTHHQAAIALPNPLQSSASSDSDLLPERGPESRQSRLTASSQQTLQAQICRRSADNPVLLALKRRDVDELRCFDRRTDPAHLTNQSRAAWIVLAVPC